MTSRESHELAHPAEGAIELGRDVCCALDRSFEMNPELKKELGKIVGENEIKFFEKLVMTDDARHLIMSDEMKTAYSQIAKRELERIAAEDEDDDDLLCGHTVDEHQNALKFVLEKMEPAVN